jgi:putative membrane protein
LLMSASRDRSWPLSRGELSSQAARYQGEPQPLTPGGPMKRSPTIACCAALATLIATPALAQDTETAERKAEQRQNHPPPLGTASFIPPESKKREPLTAENFVVRAAITNLSEIELSELALEKSSNPTLRKYATRLIEDHRAAQQKLRSVAGAAKIALPGTVDEDRRKQKQSLSERVGTDFDRQYLALMQSGHDQAIELMSSASQSQEIDAPLKGYASETLKIVKQHRQQIDELRTQMPR